MVYVYLCSRRFLLADPPIPEHPAQDSAYATPSDDGYRRDPLLEDTNKADEEYDYRADMLNYDC
jgi:hypothetical protein